MSKSFTYQANNSFLLKTVIFSLLMILLLAKPVIGVLSSFVGEDDMELCENDSEEEKELEDDQLNEFENLDFQEEVFAELLYSSSSSQYYCSVLFSKDPQEVVSPPPEA